MKWNVIPGFSSVRSPRAQRTGPLAPVRRIGQTDWIAGAVVLHDVVLLKHVEEGDGNVLAKVSGLRGLQSGLHPFKHGLFGVEELLRRLAEEDGARQRTVIAAETAGDLEEGALAVHHLLVVPGQVRRGGVRADGSSGTMAG
jgi:hypothetical protein